MHGQGLLVSWVVGLKPARRIISLWVWIELGIPCNRQVDRVYDRAFGDIVAVVLVVLLNKSRDA